MGRSNPFSTCLVQCQVSLVMILSVVEVVLGHGRLWEPPSRATMWRLGYQTPHNYDDNQLFCGGVGVQYSIEVEGKCGVCGDPWNDARHHEVGGKYATGQIVRNYDIGQVIDVNVELTANHKGYFEFRLCAKDDSQKKTTWDCLNRHVLEEVATGTTRYQVASSTQKKFLLKVRLPSRVQCKACVLQWKYNAGNSWGTGTDGKSCIGCGNQEQFYGCSDIAIGHSGANISQPSGSPKSTFENSVSGAGWNNDKNNDGNGGSIVRGGIYFTLWIAALFGVGVRQLNM